MSNNSFLELKRSTKTSFELLAKELNSLNRQQEIDDRFWQPTVDKQGNGYAVIRFLPPPPNEDLPFVKYFEHVFKGPSGLWYIEKSRTTLGEPDPVSEYNSKLWNSTKDEDSPARKQARIQKRKLIFVSNVYIINDTEEPSNNGTVKLFKYGRKIFDKIAEKLNPAFVDEQPVNVFDFWQGANFKLKIRSIDGYRNYDKSEFGQVEPLKTSDEELERIWKSEYSLKAFVAPESFKSYAELKARLYKVLELPQDEVTESVDRLASQKQLVTSNIRETAPITDTDEDEDEDLRYFQKYAS